MSIPLFDCHCDTAVRVWLTGRSLRENSLHLDLKRLKKFSPAAQVFAVCTETLEDPQVKAAAVIRYFKEEKEEEFAQNVKAEEYKYSWDRMTEVVEELWAR